MKHLLGIDIGGTKTAVVLGTLGPGGLQPVERRVFPTEAARGPGPVLDRIFQALEEVLRARRLSTGRIGGIGVSCGGPLDTRAGLVLSPPNLPGWGEVPIVRLLEERFGARTRLQNDANACAQAEWMYGAGRGCSSMIFLTFGTGLGAGLILDGRLYEGASGQAGEVGHVRLAERGPVGYGKEGSFEGFCSGGGIAQLARARALERIQLGLPVSFGESPQAREVAEAARAGDALAREVMITCGRYLGLGLAMLVDILNPQRIVLGSIFVRAGDLLWPAAAEVLERESLARSRAACTVVPAALGEALGDYAALTVAAWPPDPS